MISHYVPLLPLPDLHFLMKTLWKVKKIYRNLIAKFLWTLIQILKKKKTFFKKISITKEQVQHITNVTCNQSNNSSRFKFRQSSITTFIFKESVSKVSDVLEVNSLMLKPIKEIASLQNLPFLPINTEVEEIEP